MPFCEQCGEQLNETAKFCSNCGMQNFSSRPDAENDVSGSLELEDLSHQTAGGRRQPDSNRSRPEPSDLPPGFMLDARWEIKERIGSGPSGALYYVTDISENSEKVLKVFPEAIAKDAAAMESMRKRAAELLTLQHPKIVRVLELHALGSIKYFALEFIAGPNLEEFRLSRPDKKMTEPEVIRGGLQIAKALAYAHGQGLAHSSIHPRHVLITNTGKIKLTDFGTSTLIHFHTARLTGIPGPVPTPYSAPEQRFGDGAGPDTSLADLAGQQADIYSFGAVLYELLSGQLPFNRNAGGPGPAALPPSLIPGISGAMNAFIRKCLEYNAKRRFQGFEEVIESLKNLKTMEPLHSAVHPDHPAVTVPASGVPRKPAVSPPIYILILLVIITGFGGWRAWQHYYPGIFSRSQPETAPPPAFEPAAQPEAKMEAEPVEKAEESGESLQKGGPPGNKSNKRIPPPAKTAGTVMLITDPPGASVMINFDMKGTSPLRVTLSNDNNILVLKKDGYEPLEKSIPGSADLKEISFQLKKTESAEEAKKPETHDEPEESKDSNALKQKLDDFLGE